MSDVAMIGLLGTAGTALIAFLRWAVALWATVRREDISASKETAKLQREEGARMIDALLAQARSNAELGGKIEALGSKIETLVTWRDRTPVPVDMDEIDRPPSQRSRTNPRGYRPPRPGEHDD